MLFNSIELASFTVKIVFIMAPKIFLLSEAQGGGGQSQVNY